MSTAGWITMIISIGGVLFAAGWAYYKIFTSPEEAEAPLNPAPPLPDEE